MFWNTARFQIDLSRPRVMGIVNVTPDSFSDGGQWNTVQAALARCAQLVKEGADIIDVGAESTRPGAPPVEEAEELARLIPVVTELVSWGLPVSVDTYKPVVMQAVLDKGVDIINDVWALRQPAAGGNPSALAVVARHPRCGVCLMHMHRDPQTMQQVPMEGDVVPQVVDFLRERANACESVGVARSRLLVDPGIGFGKTAQQNLALLAHQRALDALGLGVLTGWSRKSTLGHVLGDALGGIGTTARRESVAASRRVPSVAAAMLSVQNGARVVRVHDVGDTVAALKVWQATYAAGLQYPQNNP
jgi:dihydropteroate synthase